MITNDRRAYKRVRHKFVVKYETCDTGDPATGTAVTENISKGGVYFLSLEKIPVGTWLYCYIDLPDITERGKWKARTVRCEEVEGGMIKTYGIAAEFQESFGKSQKNLDSILSAK
jgi:hypothetical protein